MPLFLARRQSSRTQAIRIGLRYLLLATYYFIMLLLNYVIFSPESVILSLGRAWLEIQKKKIQNFYKWSYYNSAESKTGKPSAAYCLVTLCRNISTAPTPLDAGSYNYLFEPFPFGSDLD